MSAEVRFALSPYRISGSSLSELRRRHFHLNTFDMLEVKRASAVMCSPKAQIPEAENRQH